MKPRFIVLFLIAVLVLSACGQKTLSEPMTLLNQDQKEVTFPSEKPTVFFLYHNLYLRSLPTATSSVARKFG